MKRLFHALAFFALLFTSAPGSAQQPKKTLNETLGLTNYLFTTDHIDDVSQFKLQRYFVDNFRACAGDTRLRVEPTWQGFKYDTHLRLAKERGITNIYCTQGKFDFQVAKGKENKINPLNDTDDPMNPASWSAYGAFVKQIALRYADDTKDKVDQVRTYVYARDDTGGYWMRQTTQPLAGLGLVDAMEDRNEWDFKKEWSGAAYTMTPEQSAVGFMVFYDSIRSVSSTMKIVMGGTINPRVETFTRFIGKLKQLYAAKGKPMPTDWYLCFHWYMRNGSIDQGNGTWGVSPETANAYRFGKQLDSLCMVYGFPGWYCTETGWATATGTTNTYFTKQNAPLMQGYDIYESQALCMWRLAMIWNATQFCKGITFWHVRDFYDVGAYTYGGVLNKDWSAKKAIAILKQYQDEYGNRTAYNFGRQRDMYYVDLALPGKEDVTMAWTDLAPSEGYDSKPRPSTAIVVPPPDPVDTTPEIPVDSNMLPVVSLTAPAGAATFTAPATITVTATALDPDGCVVQTEFYANNTLLTMDAKSPYTYTWTNVPAGAYTLTAKAIDNSGGTRMSTSVNITVQQPTPTVPPIVVKYSTSNTKSNPKTLQGATLTANTNYYIWVDSVTAPVVFVMGTYTRTENQAPWDFMGGGNPCCPTGKKFTAGTYTITVSDKQQRKGTAQFTVQ